MHPPIDFRLPDSRFLLSGAVTAFLVLVLVAAFSPLALGQTVNDEVSYPDDKVAFICGPQLRNQSSLNPAPWFDSTARDLGVTLGERFPRVPPFGPMYINSYSGTWENVITGRVTVNSGSNVVVGVGTSFTRDIDPAGPAPSYNGRLRIRDSLGIVHSVQVLSVESDTHLTLTDLWIWPTSNDTVADTYYVDPVYGPNTDYYFSDNYYDVALVQYINFYRTGDIRFRDYARKTADAWWHSQYIADGTVVGGPNRLPPRSMAFAGLMLRALDGRPEMWDYLEREVSANFDGWVYIRKDYPALYYDIREDGYAQLYAVLLAKVLPDSYQLYGNGTRNSATGTAIDGAAKRARYLTQTEDTAVNFFGRLQRPDGSWRWDADLAPDPANQIRDVEQPFMVGLYLESLVNLHQLSTNAATRNALSDQLTKAVRHLYNDTYQLTQVVTDMPQYRWRGMYYFWGGGTVADSTYFSPPPPMTTANGDTSTIRQARHLQATIPHAFGYAYFITGDPIYKNMGDEIFDSSYGDTVDGIHCLADSGKGKDYAMNYRASGRYLVWRLAGAAPTPTPTPSPTPTPTSTPTPTPTATPTPTPTATPTPTPTPAPTPSANVSFVQLDTSTKGNWKSGYGADGHNTVNESVTYPSYAQVSVAGYGSATWMASTADVRGLQKANAIDRVAARWDSNSFFTIDLNITDGQTHRVAVYSLDWDGNNRAQRVDLLDWATNALLDSRTLSSFNGGQYLVWDIRGRVRISVNRTGAKTAVVSGLYFGGSTTTPTPTATPTPTPSPSPTPTPTTGVGRKLGKVKRDGQNLSNQLATLTGSPEVAGSNSFQMESATLSELQLFVAGTQDTYSAFNAERQLLPAAARIDPELKAAVASAVQSNLSATLGDLNGTLSHLREAINHLELSDVLVTYGDIANPIDVSSYMVRQHYVDFLNREPDQSGGDFWVSQLQGCGTNSDCVETKRINASAAFFLSIEFQQTGYLVYRLYKSSYGRMPLLREFLQDQSAIARGVVVGEDGWAAKLAANQQSFLQAWTQRAHFQARYGGLSNEQYVDALIANTGAAITAVEREELIQALVNGNSGAYVIGKLVESPAFSRKELNSAFVLMQYFGYLRRDPDAAGYNFWLTKLNDFDGNFVNAEMVKAFLRSTEYRNRFGR